MLSFLVFARTAGCHSLFLHSFRSWRKECFTTLSESIGSALFLKNAGVYGSRQPKDLKFYLKFASHQSQVIGGHSRVVTNEHRASSGSTCQPSILQTLQRFST